MSKHDYSQGTVSAISEAILNSKNNISNTVLSIETMSYAWNAGIIHNVVTWFEILSILGQKEQMGVLFEKADLKLSNVSQRFFQLDSRIATNMAREESVMQLAIKKASILQDCSTQPISIADIYSNLYSTFLSLDNIDKYVSYDKNTGKYEYNWDEIRGLIQKGDLTEDEYSQLLSILDTMVNYNGEVDLEDLKKLLLYLYTDGKLYYTQGDSSKPSGKIGKELIKRIIHQGSEKYNKIKTLFVILDKEGIEPMYWSEEKPDGILKTTKKWIEDFIIPTTYGGDLLPYITIDVVNGEISVKYSESKIKYQSVSIIDDYGNRCITIYDSTNDTAHVMDNIFEKVTSDDSCYNEAIGWLKDQLYKEEPDLADKLTDGLVDKIVNIISSTCPISGVGTIVSAIDKVEGLSEEEKERVKNNQYLLEMIQDQYNHDESIRFLKTVEDRIKIFGVTGQITVEEHEDGCVSFTINNINYKDSLQDNIEEFNQKYNMSITISEIIDAVENQGALYGDNDDMLSEDIKKYISWRRENA